MPFMETVGRRCPIFLAQILSAAIFLIAIVLLIFNLVFINKPGPAVYRSPFATIYLTSCLAFQCLQLLGTTSDHPRRKCSIIFKYAYWAIVGLCGLMAGIAYSFTPKPDCVAVEILAFLDACAAFLCLYFAHRMQANVHSFESGSSGNLMGGTSLTTSFKPVSQPVVGFQHIESEVVPSWKIIMRFAPPGWVLKIIRIFNRFLLVLHVLFSILAISGAIQLALLYRFDNPGEQVEITLPNGDLRSINFNCTMAPSNGTNSVLPTIWLEADQAHGIVDFMGLQQYLATSHGRNSCAYDPPNFGWSGRLPSSSKTYYEYFIPLLKALGRQDEEIVLVGWGGGAEHVVRHAIELPRLTRGLVLLDVAPDGIEWMEERRVNNWSETQMLQWREKDLAGRVEQTRALLSLGISWGLMTVFIPANSTGFFDKTLFQRFRAQGMKEDMWAYQYYSIRDMAAGSIDTYLTTTTVPPSIPVYAVMTFNTSTTAATSEFYRNTKLETAKSIAGRNLSAPVTWCTDVDCDLGFPIKKSAWTANALVSLGI